MNQKTTDSSNIVSAVTDLVAENTYLRSMMEKYENSYVNADKFYDAALTVETVAQLHGVCNALVRKYMSLGLIEPHPMSGSGKFLIRASDALKIDFSELKMKAKYNLK